MVLLTLCTHTPTSSVFSAGLAYAQSQAADQVREQRKGCLWRGQLCHCQGHGMSNANGSSLPPHSCFLRVEWQSALEIILAAMCRSF